MVVTEAKRMGLVSQAEGQLQCYLACIRASRAEMGGNELPLYGVSSDGHEYKLLILEPGGLQDAVHQPRSRGHQDGHVHHQALVRTVG